MAETKLIPELENLTYQYLDPISYLELMGKTPEKFDKKLYQKILQQYNRKLKFYLDLENQAKQFIADSTQYILDGKRKIDPDYVVSILLDLRTTEDDDASDSDNYIIKIIEETIARQQVFIKDEHNEMINYFEDEQLRSKLEKLEPEVRLNLMKTGYQMLIDTNEKVFDTTYPLQYAEQLGPIVRNLLEKNSENNLTN